MHIIRKGILKDELYVEHEDKYEFQSLEKFHEMVTRGKTYVCQSSFSDSGFSNH